MHLAHRLVQGVDLWLNLPRVPLEACGTSGMKAALNGVPQLSTLDGWWAGGLRWAERLGDSAGPAGRGRRRSRTPSTLLRLLEEQVVPLYYTRDAAGHPGRVGGADEARAPLAGERFTARRMVQDYVQRVLRPRDAGARSPASVPHGLSPRPPGEQSARRTPASAPPTGGAGRRRAPRGGVRLATRAPAAWPRRWRARRHPGGRGIPSAVIMPLYRSVRSAAPALERVGRPVPGAGGPAHRGGAALPRSRPSRGKPQVYCHRASATSTAPGIYGEVGRGLPRQPAALGLLLPGRARGAAPGRPGAAASCTPRLAHRAGAGLPPHLPRATSPSRAASAPCSRCTTPASRATSRRHDARDRAAVGAVHLALPRVVRQAEPAQGRAHVRRRGDDGEPDPRARAAHAGGRLRPARRLPVRWATGFTGHRQRHRQAGVGPRDRPAHHGQRTRSSDLDGKARCKAALQRSFGLPQRRRIPLFAHDRRGWPTRRGST